LYLRPGSRVETARKLLSLTTENGLQKPVRKQAKEDGRKTALQSNEQTDKGNWNKEL
jgi:hypothetical protein